MRSDGWSLRDLLFGAFLVDCMLVDGRAGLKTLRSSLRTVVWILVVVCSLVAQRKRIEEEKKRERDRRRRDVTQEGVRNIACSVLVP